jgi:hypothetical protein
MWTMYLVYLENTTIYGYSFTWKRCEKRCRAEFRESRNNIIVVDLESTFAMPETMSDVSWVAHASYWYIDYSDNSAWREDWSNVKVNMLVRWCTDWGLHDVLSERNVMSWSEWYVKSSRVGPRESQTWNNPNTVTVTFGLVARTAIHRHVGLARKLTRVLGRSLRTGQV